MEQGFEHPKIAPANVQPLNALLGASLDCPGGLPQDQPDVHAARIFYRCHSVSGFRLLYITSLSRYLFSRYLSRPHGWGPNRTWPRIQTRRTFAGVSTLTPIMFTSG